MRAVVTATNTGGSTPATSAATAAVASAGGSPTNCLSTAGSGVISYASLDGCGYPSPNTTGVPGGTSLTAVSSIYCSNTTINAVYTTGPVTLGNNCAITNSRIIGDGIVVTSGVTGVVLTHDEISGSYTGSPSSPTCTSQTSSDILWEGAPSGLTLNYDYLHCAAEPFNGNGIVKNSYIISDECWGPCGSSSTTHNEAVYIAGGNDGSQPGSDLEHNTLLNPWGQVAAVFGDDHAFGPLHNFTVNNNLVASGGDAVDSGIPGNGNTNITVTNNRFSYVYRADMPTAPPWCGYEIWSGNYRDDTLASIPCG
jgi:hypothetical protein